MRLWCQRGLAALLILSVAFASNLHLPVIQVVAWAQMYSHYREGYSPEEALRITFSGDEPCKLCKFVQDAEKVRGSLEGTLTASFRILLPLPPLTAVLPEQPMARSWSLLELSAPAPLRASWPETPPPKFA
jgi:hypothetical protein